MNRGEVWWVEHPEAGRRPACVLTRQAAIPVLTSVLVAPATRTIRDIPTEVTLTRDDGMPEVGPLRPPPLPPLHTALPKGISGGPGPRRTGAPPAPRPQAPRSPPRPRTPTTRTEGA